MTHPPLSVIVPTFNRPDGLRAAILSLFAQTHARDIGFTLIIVDNAPDASASDTIEGLRADCPGTIDFVALHEPNAGVANARNTAMSAVKTDLVAFLDDDQTAPDDWLEKLLDNYAAYPASVTFGPVKTALPETQTRHRAYFENFFARLPDIETGYTTRSFGCGNALMDFSRIPGPAPWFDTAMNEIGGEDDMLFERVRATKGNFAWAGDAFVYEHPPLKRIKLHYTLKRAFGYGQGPVTLARMANPPRRLGVIKWMCVGAVKAAYYGLQWIGLSLIRYPKRAFALDKAIRGAAKVFWFVDYQFYGTAMLEKKPHRMRLFKRRQLASDEGGDAH